MENERNYVREAFQKAKHDIYSLYSEISAMKRSIAEMRHEIAKISEILLQITQNTLKRQKNQFPAHQAHRHINQTFQAQNPANIPFSDSKHKENKSLSTGNEGVPADRQTDQQTDNTSQNQLLQPRKASITPSISPAASMSNAAQIIDSLDDLRKEIRLKFKQLTNQEILVFSALYQLEEEHGPVDYKALAGKLSLTESSIRDYIARLLKKGIPVDKTKVNNKQINLSIPQNLKKIASLSTILQLRDL